MTGMLQAKLDDLRGAEIIGLLNEHVSEMRRVSPPGSSHALDLDGLRAADVRFWSFWQGEILCGCGALKELDGKRAEIKSMRLPETLRGQGLAGKILQHLLSDAKSLGKESLWLETGSFDFFQPARRLYEQAGFTYCDPFDGYQPDPASVFMTLQL